MLEETLRRLMKGLTLFLGLGSTDDRRIATPIYI